VAIESREWLGLLRDEYLDDYIRQGGAAVKFALVADDGAGTALIEEIGRTAVGLDYLVASVSAAKVRIHLMQQLFHEVARQTPWQELARRVVRRCYSESGLQLPEDGDLGIEAVAERNQADPAFLRVELRQQMHGLLGRSHELAKDFRVAMLWLCMAQVSRPGGGGTDEEAILDWLRGDLRLISAVKRLLIFRKIGRHNARAMFSSLGAWCRLAGLRGLVLALDVRQLSVPRRAEAAEDTFFYGPAAVMDAYEVLRQLIDATDDLTGVLCVVLAEPRLFEDERRGVRIYKALYERVASDVRLRQQPNPLSALAELADGRAAA
jgi:hypothetical protein